MFKPITRIASAALLTVAASAVTAGAAEVRCLYLNGSDNGWVPPTTQYQEFFDAHSLTETAEGSNVYTGTADFSSRYFRMYYALSDSAEIATSNVWNMYNVCPALDYSKLAGEGEEFMKAHGRSGVMTASARTFREVPVISNWRLKDSQFGSYFMTVDLNRGTFTMIPEGSCVMVFGNDPAPTIATADKYVRADSYTGYFPAGELSFRLYDLAQEKWANPVSDFDFPCGERTVVALEYSTEKGAPITVDGWEGGVLTLKQGRGYVYVTPTPDKLIIKGETSTDLYLPGDYSTPLWSLDAEDIQHYTSAEPSSRFEITLPAGTKEWKISLDRNWERNYGPSALVVEADGSYTAFLEQEGRNFVMKAPLTAEARGVVDLEKMTVTFPAGTPIETFGTRPYESDGSYPADIDELLLVSRGASIIPWEGASVAVMDRCVHIPATEGGYTATLRLEAEDFVLISKRAAIGEAPAVFAPKEGADRELVYIDGSGFSSAVSTSLDKAGYWTVPSDMLGKWVTLTVTPATDGRSARMTITDPGRIEESAGIYMVGSSTGWDITASDVVLQPTTDGGYYGSAEVDAGSGYSAPTFRFYSRLGNWDEFSIGSQYDDMPLEIDMEGGLYEGSCVSGKGSWTLSGWDGGTLYMYVNREQGKVRFSAVPMDYTIDPNPQPEKRFYLYGSDRQGGRELYRRDNGLFIADMSLSYADEPGIESYYIFTEKPNMAPDDPEWGKKGLIKPAAEGALEPDRFNVGETTFTDAAEGEMPMLTVDRSKFRANGNYTAVLSIDPETNKIYFESWGRGFYLTGAIADNKELTYANRQSWADFFMPCPGPKEIPAGKFDMTLRRSIFDNGDVPFEEKAVFGEDKVSLSTNTLYGYMKSHVTCDDWKGGLVMIGGMSMMDITDLSEISALTYGKDNKAVYSPLRREAGSHVYTGKVKMVPAESVPMLSFLLNRDDSHEREFFVGSTRYYDYYGTMVADNSAWLMPEGDTYSSAMGVNSSSFMFPTFTGEGELDVRVDLGAMTMTAVAADENNRPIYEAVADEDSPLDGALVLPSTDSEDAMTAAATVGDDGEFNFTRPDGTTLAPAEGEEEITFGADGTWEGNAVVSGAPASTRMKARAAAMEAGKWKFSLPEGVESTELSILLDEKAGKLKVFSSAHNTDTYYILAPRHGKYEVWPYIEYIDLLKQNVLRRNAAGVFEGEIAVDDSEEFDVEFYSSLRSSSGYYSSFGRGISLINYGNRVFDFGAENAETLVKGACGDRADVSPLRIVAPGKTVHISFDPQAYELTMTVPTGVDNVSVDRAGAISVVPGTGVLRVTAPEGGHIDVYSVSGMLVRSTDLVPGTTEIELPAGVYLAAGRKFFVR